MPRRKRDREREKCNFKTASDKRGSRRGYYITQQTVRGWIDDTSGRQDTDGVMQLSSMKYAFGGSLKSWSLIGKQTPCKEIERELHHRVSKCLLCSSLLMERTGGLSRNKGLYPSKEMQRRPATRSRLKNESHVRE